MSDYINLLTLILSVAAIGISVAMNINTRMREDRILITPKLAKAMELLGGSASSFTIHKWASSESIDEAKVIIDECLTIQPKHQKAKLCKAMHFRLTGDTFRAKLLLQEILKKDPRSVEANCDLLHLTFHTGEEQQAVWSIRELHYSMPNVRDYFDLYIRLLMETGQFSEAIQRIENIQDNMFDKSLCFFLTGEVYCAKRDFELALRAYYESLRLNHMQYPARFGIGYCHIFNSEQNLPLAIKELRSYLLYRPNCPKGWELLALAYFQVGEFDRSIECGIKAIEITPNLPDALGTLSHSYERNGDIKKAFYYADEHIVHSTPPTQKDIARRDNLYNLQRATPANQPPSSD